ncbi:MAG TPA: ABC transporter ATP-binding protein [Cellulomonas sp.]
MTSTPADPAAPVGGPGPDPAAVPTAPPAGGGEGFFAPVRGSLAAIIGLALLGAVSGVVPFVAIVELARALLPALDGATIDAARVRLVVLVAVVALLVSLGSAFASGMVAHLADAELQLTLRRRIVQHLQRLPLGWFDARSSGTVRKLVENDVTALHQMVAHAIQDVVTAIAVPLVSIAYLASVQWQLAVAAVLPLVAAVGLYGAMMRGGTEKYQQYDAATERLSGATVEFVHGIAVVKRFGQVGRSHRRYREQTDEYVDFVGRWTRESAGLQSVIEVVTSPVVVLVYLLAVGTWLVSTGAAQAIDVLPGVLLGLGLTGPLLKLGSSAQFLRNATKAREHLLEFFALPPVEQLDPPRTPQDGTVAVQDVSFSYDGQHRVLQDITATCAPGTVTALVGASGSGKSTLATLVPRFYDPAAGRVEIGGADVRHVPADRLYREVGFVLQDVQLLRTSLRDNLRLTRPAATDAEIVAAARAAQIHDRILRFDRGYDSVVGQDAHLSGGEAQRVAIARALLADAPVLVLDEATAFADPDSEAAIQDALSALAADRTVLVIAHRLHTVVGVDQILVLDGGRVVERGRHAELVAAGGRYARMWADYQANHARTLPEGASA